MDQALATATRATGLVTFLLLTGALVGGITTAGRVSGPGWPRFALAALHRNVSLLAVLFLAVHVSASILDSHTRVRWFDVLVPFLSNDHPLLLGLGTVALDLLLAATATSMLRTRLSLRLWRGVHWAAYASWPVALLHGVLIGSADIRRVWVLGLYVGCVAAVSLALLWRFRTARNPDALAEQPTNASRVRPVTHGRR